MNNKTLEGNKLIHSFVGWGVNDGYEVPKPCVPNGEFFRETTYNVTEWGRLEFHSSWDWLKVAIDKINKLDEDESDNWLAYILEDTYPGIFELKITESIHSVYNQVVSFIEWYNVLNKEPEAQESDTSKAK